MTDFKKIASTLRVKTFKVLKFIDDLPQMAAKTTEQSGPGIPPMEDSSGII